ncbi:hypothetical protein F4679DRAFT_330121 [Xylaria curta]|nr:hypothetical protein F4679DRAFT_330121 [Xylaria curta]
MLRDSLTKICMFKVERDNINELRRHPGLQDPTFPASQEVFEKNKRKQSALVHELAVGDQSLQHLKNVWTGADSDLKSTVEKIADFNKSTEKRSLKKMYWKELDVWNYNYDTPEDRQSAIDNAIKVYNEQSVAKSEAAWDRLLP